MVAFSFCQAWNRHRFLLMLFLHVKRSVYMGIAIGIEHSGGTGMHKKKPGFSKMLQRETWKDRKKIL